MFGLARKLLDRMSQGVVILESVHQNDSIFFDFKYFNSHKSINKLLKHFSTAKPQHLINQQLNILDTDKFKINLSSVLQEILQTNQRKTFDDVIIQSESVDEIYKIELIPLSDTEIGVLIDDISQQKQMENELITSKNRYEKLIQDAPYGIVGQEKGIITFVNKAYLDIYRIDQAEDIVGKSLTMTIAPEYRQQILQRALNREIGIKEPRFYETEGIKSDGTIFPMTMHIARIHIGGKDISIAFVNDISDYKKLVRQLELKEKMDSIGVLAGGIVHDFNNILTIISLNLSAIDFDNVSDANRVQIKSAVSAAEKASEVIAQIRLLSSETSFNFEKINFTKIINDVIDLLKPKISKYGIKVQGNYSVNNFEINANQTHINQIFINLLTNSIDAISQKGNQGMIGINIEKLVKKDHNMYQITIRDNGVGIPESIIERIFDPLFTTKELHDSAGSGLGLSMVMNIIKKFYDGDIEVTSEQDKFTEFTIILPIIEEEENNLNVPISDHIIDDLRGSEKILIIEDNQEIQKSLKKSLERLGYTVINAENGEIGMKYLQKCGDSIDLIILDMIMPVMSGEVFMQEFDNKYSIPILISSGFIDEFNLPATIEILPKPYTIYDLGRKIREMVVSQKALINEEIT